MKPELFELFKKALLNKADNETICALLGFNPNDEARSILSDDERLTNNQIRILIEEKILPRLDGEQGKEQWNMFFEEDLMPIDLCNTCLEICPEMIRSCDNCYIFTCSKCMPMIETRYADEPFRESMCIKCFSDAIS